jgi:phenylalanyl-tRNA synthetase beta chain
MLVSLQWVGDYVSLPSTVDPIQMAADLTMSTVEVEGVVDLRRQLMDVYVAEISDVAPHPDADRLRVCQCDFGNGDRVQVVCGGSNVTVGMRVAVARVGAVVRKGDARVEMRLTTIRGVDSHGMICSAAELGLEDLFPPDDASCVMDLDGVTCAPGDALCVAVGYDDVILEIDNKSLTNRPDLWGHYGIARELAAIYECPLNPMPGFDPPTEAGDLSVAVEDPRCCSRYTATRITGVTVRTAPFWMRSRLARVGQRPINFLVDLTNFVMLATGQPTHAFDARQLSGPLQIRNGRDAERLRLLDGTQIQVDPDILAIADDTGCLALAGVMGGDRSGIAPDTTEMILEAAHFEPQGVRRASGRSGTRTESSTRFEKGLDPYLVDQALGLLMDLLSREQPDARARHHVDVFPEHPAPVRVHTTAAFICRRLGTSLPTADIAALLTRLGFEVTVDAGSLDIGVPSWRATGDVDLPEDIVEEVARLYGYESLAFVPPRVALTRNVNQPRHRLERRIRESLAFRGGLQEVFTYPWVEDKFLAAAGMETVPSVALATPPAPDMARLRPSLVPQLLKAVASNLRYTREFRIFEMATVFAPSLDDGAEECLPQQRKRFAGALVGIDAGALFLEAKGLIEPLARTVQMCPLSLSPGGVEPWSNEAASLRISTDGVEVGTLALVSSRAKRLAGIRLAEVVLFEIELAALVPLASRDNTFAPLSPFPQVSFDVSFVIGLDVVWEDVRGAIDGADPLVREVIFVDEYRGAQVPDDKKSVTLRLQIGSSVSTLKAAQIESAAGAAMARIQELGGEIRRE